MKLKQVPLREIDCSGSIVRASTPYILEYEEVAALAEDLFRTYARLINPAATALGPRQRESNADSYALLDATGELGRLHVVYDLDETRLAVELRPTEATKLYRLLREQRIVRPDLDQIRRLMSGNLAETVAAVLWQIGAIKVSMGDLRPLFRVDAGRNYSPIYIDVKGLTNYPEVNDFVMASAALLIRNLDFDLVCGIEAGSIAIAALLAQKLGRPMFFARRERRYPEASPFEGVRNHELFRRRVLLVDDTMVHGWTKTRVIREIRAWGGRVDACFVVFDRQQAGGYELEQAGVKLLSLTGRDAALSDKIPREISYLTDDEYAEVVDYFRDVRAWHQRRGLLFQEPQPAPLT
ncbi:MAG: phosphoribosyltransferase family protein [candidate division WOR-3 bacterium]